MRPATFILGLLFFAFSQGALACKPKAGEKYERPTNEEKYSQAEVVIVVKVLDKKQIFKLPEIAELPPYTYLLNVEVEKWLKNSGPDRLNIIDTTGTDCDVLFGTRHIVTDGAPLDGKWLVYIRKRQGHYFVTTAERLN